jgi:hypothetical protein
MKNKSLASENRVIRNIVTKDADFQVLQNIFVSSEVENMKKKDKYIYIVQLGEYIRYKGSLAQGYSHMQTYFFFNP